MILGIAGASGAGKGEAIHFLQECGFQTHSLSDEIRTEAWRQEIPETRENLIRLGNEMRATQGHSALAKRLLPRLHPALNHAVDSIRHTAEVECLRQHAPNFHLLWIEAAEETRLHRIMRRNRPGEAANLRTTDRIEQDGQNPAGQQLDAIREHADRILKNEGTILQLQNRVKDWLQSHLRFTRPSWDQYFMQVAHESATRSNCVKRRLAAVLTMDHHIVAVGYNGTPKGMKNCNEGGCPRCARFGKTGEGLDQCLCAHAEENAIAQSAQHGTATQGATLYCTFCPCRSCAKLITGAGIQRVVYQWTYDPEGDRQALWMLKASGVQTEQIRD